MTDAKAVSSPIISKPEREVTVTHVFDAPRELVFKAWLDPKHLQSWWGPHKFTNPICELDARVGGKWHIVMRGPNGMDYPCGGVYREIVEPEILVYKHTPEKGTEPGTHESTVTFEEQDGQPSPKTKVIIRMLFGSAAARDYVVKKYNAIEGGNQTPNRLGEHLAKNA